MKTISIVTGMICMAALAWAAESDSPLVIRRVALFKNGLGYFVADTTLPGTSTVCFGQIPVPSLGTFWLGYPSNTPVRALVTSMEDVTETNVARSMAEIMAANIGRKASLGVAGAATSMVEGVILDVPKDAVPRRMPSPYVMDTHMPRGYENYNYNPYGAGGQLAVVKTFNGVAVVNIGSITRLDLPGADVITTVATTTKRPSLRLELDRPAPGTKVTVSYLARGITWFPSYLIDLSHSTTARLSAKAVVVNEVADLANVQLELVTGFPNIQLADISSPLAMSQPLADFLSALTTGRSESRDRGYGYMVQQQGDYTRNATAYDRYTSSPQPAYSTAQEGRSAEDLFLYPAGSISLKRGETACIPLFTTELPYTHLYTWRIPDFINEDARWADRTERDNKPREEEVWHCCRIRNTMGMPWTTAPAEFVKDGQFTGQDTCYYTAQGSEATIRINRAMNVLADQAEYEVKRTRSATNFYGYIYDRVEVKGQLKLCNKLASAATIEIAKDVSGTVLESAPKAKDVTTAKGLKRVNPSHTLTWSLVVEPGKEESLSYNYEVFIRN